MKNKKNIIIVMISFVVSFLLILTLAIFFFTGNKVEVIVNSNQECIAVKYSEKQYILNNNLFLSSKTKDSDLKVISSTIFPSLYGKKYYACSETNLFIINVFDDIFIDESIDLENLELFIFGFELCEKNFIPVAYNFESEIKVEKDKILSQTNTQVNTYNKYVNLLIKISQVDSIICKIKIFSSNNKYFIEWLDGKTYHLNNEIKSFLLQYDYLKEYLDD